MQCLRAANTTALVNMEHDNLAFGVCAFPFVPIVDGVYLPAHPATLLAAGTYPPRDILLGANQEEGAYFLIYYLTDIFQLTENVSTVYIVYVTLDRW